MRKRVLSAPVKPLLSMKISLIPTALSSRVARRPVISIVALLLACCHLNAQQDLALDPSFNREVLDRSRVQVEDVVVQSDGKYVVAGSFIYVDGVQRETLVRLLPDGSLDDSFAQVSANGSIRDLAIAADDMLYVSGFFSEIHGATRPGVARLTSDGQLDETFLPVLGISETVGKILPLADGGLYLLTIDSDVPGGIIRRLSATSEPQAGFSVVTLPNFSSIVDAAIGLNESIIVLGGINGSSMLGERFKRFLSNGDIDTGFTAPGNSGSLGLTPRSIVVESDGSMVLAGFGNSGQPQLVRLLPDGARDDTFSGHSAYDVGTDEVIRLSDGSFIVKRFGGPTDPDPYIFRFLANGDFDSNFDLGAGPDAVGSTAFGLLALPDGNFVVLGGFLRVDDLPAPHIVRVSPAGELQGTPFVDFETVGNVLKIAAHPDGSVLVGGKFSQVDELTRQNLLRINTDGSVDPQYSEVDDAVTEIAFTSDNGTIVIGEFSAPMGAATKGVFKLGTDGTVDDTFLADITQEDPGYRFAAAMPDGSVVLAGTFVVFVQEPEGLRGRGHILRVLADGSADVDFALNGTNTALGPTGNISALAADFENRLLVSGSFGDIQNVSRPRIARTDSAGVLDLSFEPEIGVAGGTLITPLPNGGFYVRGTRLDESKTTLVRYNSDGSIDEDFVLGLGDLESIITYAVAGDGSLLVATATQGESITRISRALASGELLAPLASVSGSIRTMTFDDDGRLWLGGTFRAVNGQRRIGLARLTTYNLSAAIEGSAERIVPLGESITLAATYDGSELLPTFEWNRNGVPISGARGSTLTVDEFDASVAGTYTVTAIVESIEAPSNAVALLLPVAPTITTHPAMQEITGGASVTLSIEIAPDIARPVAYQWYLDGVAVPGAIEGTYVVPSAQTFQAGDYTVVVTNPYGEATSNAATLSVSAPSPNNARLLNLSTRGLAQTGDNVLIPGFVISGTDTKRLLIRAVGPTLEITFGLSGVLPDPRIVLKRWNGSSYDDIASNDNWGNNANAADIIQTSADVYAFGLKDDREAVLLLDLPAGQYTAVVDDVNGGSGVGVVELYDADDSSVDARLINISTRGFVGVDTQVMIPGFVVSSEGPKTFLIRVVGARLAQPPFNLNGVLADPKLELYGRPIGGTDALLFTQDNWGDNPDAANTAATASAVYAFGLEDGSADAAFVVTLQPGIYTVVGSAADCMGTGVAIVEVYVVP